MKSGVIIPVTGPAITPMSNKIRAVGILVLLNNPLKRCAPRMRAPMNMIKTAVDMN